MSGVGYQLVAVWAVVTGQCGDPIVCLGRAGRGASLPQPAVEHSGYVMHMYILYVRKCVIELFVLSAGDLGSVDITYACPILDLSLPEVQVTTHWR